MASEAASASAQAHARVVIRVCTGFCDFNYGSSRGAGYKSGGRIFKPSHRGAQRDPSDFDAGATIGTSRRAMAVTNPSNLPVELALNWAETNCCGRHSGGVAIVGARSSQPAASASSFLRGFREAAKPRPARPRSIIAQVESSGTTGSVMDVTSSPGL